MQNTRGTSQEAARRCFGGTRVYSCHRVLLGRWESDKYSRPQGVTARFSVQLESNRVSFGFYGVHVVSRELALIVQNETIPTRFDVF